MVWKLNKWHQNSRSEKIKRGKNASLTSLTDKEIKEREIYYGFHFFTNKNDLFNRNDLFGIVCKFEVKTKDIVAIGKFNGKASLVSTNAKFLGQYND